jgi:hypothetical protein
MTTFRLLPVGAGLVLRFEDDDLVLGPQGLRAGLQRR